MLFGTMIPTMISTFGWQNHHSLSQPEALSPAKNGRPWVGWATVASHLGMSHIWTFPEIAVPPNHPFLIVFFIINHSFGSTSQLWKPPYIQMVTWACFIGLTTLGFCLTMHQNHFCENPTRAMSPSFSAL